MSQSEHQLSPLPPEVASALAEGPFHAALRAAISARGLGLERLRHHLLQRGIDVSVASLSYWQHGRSRPSQPSSLLAVDELETILNIPAGSLRALLGPMRPRGPRSLRAVQPHPEAVLDGNRALSDLADLLPATREYQLDVVTQEITAMIDSEGRDALHRVVTLVRSRGPDVDRHVIMFRGDPGCSIDEVEVRGLRDCTVGRVVRHDRYPVLLAEIVFGVALQSGDNHLFEFHRIGGNTRPAMYVGQAYRYPAERCTIQIRFDPEMVPRRVYGFAQSRMDGQHRETGDLRLSSWNTALISRSAVEPGAVGIGWEW